MSPARPQIDGADRADSLAAQAAQRNREVHIQESAGACAAGKHTRPPQERLRGSGRRVVPGRIERLRLPVDLRLFGRTIKPDISDQLLETASTRSARLVGAVVVCIDVQNLAGGLQVLMSGICAVWRRDHPGRTAATLAAVSEGLVLAAGEHVAEERDPLAGVGVCARFASQQVLRTERVLCACDADLDNLDDLVKLAGDEKLAIEGPIAGLLVALYERFGDAFVERLRGGFSFVLCDRRKRRLIAAVDHFGVKRLAYYQDAALTLVASRLDALIRASEVSRKINPHAIANVVNYSISPRS